MGVLMMLALGFAVLAVFIYTANYYRRIGANMLLFAFIWFLLTSLNVWILIAKGYFLPFQVFPLFIITFSIPCFCALLIYFLTKRNSMDRMKKKSHNAQ